jgi:HSP20 family molecular chaperone IbpA
MAQAKKTKKKDNAPLVRSDSFLETFEQLQDKIQRRAFEIFQGRHDHEGDELSDWLRAESDVLTSIAMELQEEDDQYVLTGELPSDFQADEIEINVSGGMLSVGGTHRTQTQKKKGKGKQESRSEISFMRRMTLPDDADIDHAAAQYKKGKLRLTFPKASA